VVVALFEQRFGQTHALLAEDQGVTLPEGRVQVASASLSAEIPALARLPHVTQPVDQLFGRFQGGMLVHFDQMPVVKARPSDSVGVSAEAERFHQVQGTAGGGAQAGDVSSVRWDLWLDEHHVERPCQSPGP
jgi:hypothetical protein